ncbi:radical SAM protein [Mesorhizobium sp. M0910]|uniref:radical SAM protein n=1 Tax=Mesorhizobium sp. M0910 TaxID=2957025 RepID=UPI00333B9E3F
MLREVRIEVNKRCNLACAHCYTDKKGSLAPISTMEDAIAQAKSMGATDLSLTGGEPLLDPERTLALVRAGKANGMRVRLNTNGWFADRPMQDRLHQSGLTELQVSMSHADPEAFDRFVRRKGAFEHALSAITTSSNLRMQVTVRCTLMNSNVDQLQPLYELTATAGATSFKIRALVEVNGVADLEPEVNEARRLLAIEALKKSADSRRVPISFADEGEFELGSHPYVERLECKCGELAVFITAEGVVTPCPFLREDSRYWCGDINRQPIGEIMHSDTYRHFVGNRTSGSCGNDAACACKANRVSEPSHAASTSRHIKLQ